jgi:hypothetical protein
LDGLSRQVDVIRAQIAAKTRQDSARRLDNIERSLRRMRVEIEASEHSEDIAVEHEGKVAVPRPDEAPEGVHGATRAVEHRHLQIDHVIEVVDRGIKRIEAIGAEQMAEMRGEIAQVLEALAARISIAERPIGPEAEVEAQHSPFAAPSELDPLFDAPAERLAASVGTSIDAAPLPVDPAESTVVPHTAGAAADCFAFYSASFDLTVAKEDTAETAIAESDPSDWRAPTDGAADLESSAKTLDAPSDELSILVYDKDQIAERSPSRLFGQGKSFVFPRLSFGHGRLHLKTA